MKIFLIVTLLFNLNAAQLDGERYNIEKVVKLKSIPWGFDFLPENKLIITTQSGSVFIYNLKTKTLNQIYNFKNVDSHGQGGLMDVKVHPDFKKNNLIFFSYILKYQKGIGTVISKAKLAQGKLTNNIIFRSNPPGDGGRHFGSRIVLKDGKVFFSVGDRGDRKKAQKLNSNLGKILRINEDGSIPDDNPFKSKVWSYGHRNPQGLYFDKTINILFSNEHGPRGGDELNIIKKGVNYGWPVITYGKEYWGPSIGTTRKKGMEQPLKYYIPSFAPSSLLIYSGKLFKNWKGHIFQAALKFDYIGKLKLNKQNKPVNETKISVKGRVRHLEEDPNTGEIYFSLDDGNIYKMNVSPKGSESKLPPALGETNSAGAIKYNYDF